VLTALVVLENLDPAAVVEGTAEDVSIEGSKAGIGPGGRYTVRELLAGLLLNSGNDTAHALARAVGGTAAMTREMGATARALGALDTRAATPSGLDGPGMSSSAYDLALLFRVAMRDPLFAETVALRSIPFPGYGAEPGFELSNANRLLARYPGALGGKTGFTQASRHTFVGAATRDGRRLVVVLVRGEQQPVPMWQQAAALLDLGFALPLDHPAVGVLVDAAPVTRPDARRAPRRARARQPGAHRRRRRRGRRRARRAAPARPPPVTRSQALRRPPSSRSPSTPVTTPAPTRPAAVRPSGPDRTTTSGRITAGPGTGVGCSCSFSLLVAAHAVTNRTNREAKKTNTSNPRNDPNTAPLGELVTLLR
jgi:D-alanyl-D-alanine carboxypeptidase